MPLDAVEIAVELKCLFCLYCCSAGLRVPDFCGYLAFEAELHSFAVDGDPCAEGHLARNKILNVLFITVYLSFKLGKSLKNSLKKAKVSHFFLEVSHLHYPVSVK